MRGAKIDWEWVRKELFRKERVDKVRDAAQKRFIAARADEAIADAKTLVKPAARSVRHPAARLGREKLVRAHLKGTSHIEALIVTIGARLEEEARRRMGAGDSLRGYLLDRAGSFAVESLAESAESAIRAKYAAASKSVSARYSPGYCDFPIKDQLRLSRLAGFRKAGVRLSRSCMMVPVKSVSAIVGIGPKGIFRKSRTQCVRCNKKDCSYRRS